MFYNISFPIEKNQNKMVYVIAFDFIPHFGFMQR